MLTTEQWERYYPALARRWGEDVASEAVVRLIAQNIETLSPQAYLWETARNLARSEARRWRRGKGYPLVLVPLSPTLSVAPEQERRLLARETLRTLCPTCLGKVWGDTGTCGRQVCRRRP